MMIQANDPRLKTNEGWDELGAPEDATHWIGPHEDPWEKHEGNNRVTWIEEVKQWSDYTFAVRTGVDEISCDYTIIPRPISEDAKAELTLEPMIQANDPRLTTPEGWIELGATEGATHWVGPHTHPWEKHENGNRFLWIADVQRWSNYTVAVRADYTVIPRPLMEEAKAELTLEPMTDSDGEEIVTSYNSGSDKFKAENKWHNRSDFPPAGTECYVMFNRSWHNSRVIGMDGNSCVAYLDKIGYISRLETSSFKPRETKDEQNRYEAIEEMLKLSPYPASKIAREICSELYNEGYCKPVSREDIDSLHLPPFTRQKILNVLGYE